MARYIHCEDCKNRIAAGAKKHGELYEFLEGTAKFDMFCDGGGHNKLYDIKQGDKCFAAVLLSNRSHFNYEQQKPESWAENFIEICSHNS